MSRRNDVVFSSERLESQERLKKILIPLAVLLLIVAAVVAAAFIMRSVRGTSSTGGEDTPYPYSWRNNSKGVMTLEIDRGGVEGSSWLAVNNDPANMPVETAQKQPKGADRFTVTPTGAGRSNQVFVLMGEDGEASVKLEMLMEAALNDKGVLQTEVLSSSILERQRTTQGGADSAYPYSYTSDTDGFLVVTVSGAAVYNDWDCSCDNEAAAYFAGLFYEEDDIITYLCPGTEPGNCTAVIFSKEGGVELTLELELSEGGAILVRNDSIVVENERPV